VGQESEELFKKSIRSKFETERDQVELAVGRKNNWSRSLAPRANTSESGQKA
jgi:hypothetical protein